MMASGSAVQTKGLGCSLASRKKAVNSGLQLDNRAEDTALKPLPRQLGEEALDGVEPGTLIIRESYASFFIAGCCARAAVSELPRGEGFCRATEQRDEIATAAHSITSSAMASTPGGIVTPSV